MKISHDISTLSHLHTFGLGNNHKYMLFTNRNNHLYNITRLQNQNANEENSQKWQDVQFSSSNCFL